MRNNHGYFNEMIMVEEYIKSVCVFEESHECPQGGNGHLFDNSCPQRLIIPC